MPQLPQLRDIRSVAVGAPQTPDLRPARGLTEGLDAIGQASNEYLAAKRQKEDERDRIWAQQQVTEIRAAETEARSKRWAEGADLSNLPDQINTQFEADVQKRRTAAPSKNAAKYLDLATPELKLGFHAQAREDADKYLVQKNFTGLVDGVEKARGLVFNNPGMFAKTYAEQKTLIDSVQMPTELRIKMDLHLKELGASAIEGKIRNGNPYQAAKELKSGAWNNYINPDKLAALANMADGEIRSREAEAKAAQAAASADIIATLGVRINQYANGQTNDVSQLDIDAIKDKVRPATWATLQTAFDDARARREASDGARVNVAQLIESGGHIDPTDSKQKAGYDAYFRNDVLPRLAQSANPDAAVIEFVGRQGVIPETLKAKIRTDMRAGTPEEKIAATQMLDQFKSINPQIVNDFSEEEIRLGSLVSANIDRGMKPNEAVRAADEALRVPKGTRQALEQAYNDQTKIKGVDGTTAQQRWLKSQFADWWRWTGSINVLPAVAAESDEVVRNEYVRNGGDLEAARKSASDILRARFGVSEVNGSPTIMRNPPEQHYEFPGKSPSVVAKAIRDEAIADVAADALKDPSNPISTDTVRLLPYPIIGRTSPDGKPVYAVQVRDAAGQWHTQIETNPKALDYGNPKAWYPSLSKLREAHAAETKREIQKARGEMPEGAQVKGGEVYSPPGEPRRLIGYMRNGKFTPVGPQ